MSIEWAETVVGIIALYAAIGVAFAVVFLGVGLRRIDPIAADGPFRFKLLIAPGIAALWPAMILLWARGRGGA